VSEPDRNGPSETGTGKVSTRRAYSGRIINLDIDRVRFPNGSIGELEMIRHPGASAVIPFVAEPSRDGEILLIKQYRYAAERFLYEVPAGRLDPGEQPIDCARRELKEETGCSARGVEYLLTIYTTPGFTDEQIHVFLAYGLERGDTAHEPDEFMSIETVTMRQALEFVQTGAVVDAKTALAILYTSQFRLG
jgi:ADP-ribose pyrophosphatase